MSSSGGSDRVARCGRGFASWCHRLRRHSPQRHRLDQIDGLLEPFQLRWPALLEANVLDLGGELRDGSRHQDLSGQRLGAQPGRRVERDPPEPVLDRDRLAHVDPDPDRQRKVGGCLGFLHARDLELQGGANGLCRGVENGERLVPPELDDPAAPSFDSLPCELGEPRGESGRLAVAVFPSEARVPTTSAIKKVRIVVVRFGWVSIAMTAPTPGSMVPSSVTSCSGRLLNLKAECNPLAWGNEDARRTSGDPARRRLRIPGWVATTAFRVAIVAWIVTAIGMCARRYEPGTALTPFVELRRLMRTLPSPLGGSSAPSRCVQ